MSGKLLAIFDLGWYAPTFDIYEFALNARVWAQRHGMARVKLVILQRPFAGALVRQPQLPHDYDFRLADILLGSSSLLGVDGVELTSDLEALAAAADADRSRVFPPDWSAQLAADKLQPHRYYLERFMRDHLAAGGQVPGIRVPPAAFSKVAALMSALPRPWISITLRDTPYQQLRNSNPATWQGLRAHFERRGASVIFIPDIEAPAALAAAGPLGAMAMANVVYRAALYDACDLNLAAVGGGIAPAMFNPCSVHVITKFGTAGSNSSAQRMQDLWGMAPGSPLFYRVPWQLSLWEGDEDAARLIAQAQAMLDFVAALRDAIADKPTLCDPWGKPDGTLRGFWDGVRSGMNAREIRGALDRTDSSPGAVERQKDSSPFSCKPWIAAAQRLLAAGDPGGALVSIKRGIAMDGRYASAYAIAAHCLRASGQEALADRYLATAQNLQGKK